MAMKRLLVVGGSGFIGGHLCRVARERGYEVTSLSIDDATRPLADVEYVVGDISKRGPLMDLLEKRKYEYVVNCGGYIDHSSFFSGGRELVQSHFEGVQNLVDAIDRRCLKRFVQIGSSDEYGSADAPQSESMRESPISPYSLAKVAASHFLQMLWRTEGFPAVTLRFFLVYGPGQGHRRFLPQIISGCLRNKSFPASEGRQLRDFCYIDDVVEGILRSLDAPDVCGRVINLASGRPVSIRDMIEQVRDVVGQGKPEFGKVPYRVGENMALWADVAVARELLDWSPKVSLDTGLKRTIEFYRNENDDI